MDANQKQVKMAVADKATVGVRRVGRMADVHLAMAATGMSEEQINRRILQENHHITPSATVYGALNGKVR